MFLEGQRRKFKNPYLELESLAFLFIIMGSLSKYIEKTYNFIRCSKCHEWKKKKAFKRIDGRLGLSKLCSNCQRSDVTLLEEPFVRYRIRDATLKKMGYSSYKNYLESPLWRSIRGRVLARDGDKCRICGSEADHVHHQRYNRAILSGRDIRELLSLCSSCHKGFEFDDNGKKRDILEVKRLAKNEMSSDITPEQRQAHILESEELLEEFREQISFD